MSRSRRVTVAFAVVASLLVVAAQPAAAAHQLTNVSVNDTAVDFNAGTLTNMSISGSGASATVELASSNAVDTFEDGDISEYSGDTGSFTVQNTVLIDGQWTLKGETGASGGAKTIISTSGLGSYPSAGDANFSQTVRLTETDDIPEVSFGVQDANNRYTVILHAPSDEIRIFKVSGGSGTELNAVSAPLSSNLNENLTVTIDWDTDGSMTATVEEESGSSLGSVSASDTTWSSGGIGFVVNTADAATRTMYFDGLITVGLPGEYINTHSANDTTAGFVHVTSVNNVSFDVNITGDADGDGVYETTLNLTTGLTTAANHSFTWTEFSDSAIQVDIDITSTGTDEAFVLEREGVQSAGVAPSVDNSSASPTGPLTTATPTLSIGIDDGDFPDAQGDTVTARFYVDGTLEGTDTLTANGTASLTTSALSGGDHTWQVFAVDEYGHNVSSQTFDISTPGNVTIRRESPPHAVIDDRDVDVTIYGEADGDQFVQNFTTSNGNVSLSGVPVDERLVLVVVADGYYQRESVILDVFTQSNIYLLNTSMTAVNVTFDIQDTTGDFSRSDTEFIIERSINKSLFDSGGFTAEAVAGDRLGAVTEYRATLKRNQRYTLTIRNPGGDERVLGAQVAKTDGTVTIRINSVDLTANETQGFNTSATLLETGGSTFVQFTLVDSDDATDSVDLVIYEYQNATNEIHNQTHTGPYGTLQVTEQLTGDQVNQTWAVDYTLNRGGETFSGTIVIGQDTNPLGVPLDAAWKGRIALLSLVVVGFIVGGGVSPEAGGIGIVSAAGLWLYVGWMPAEVTAVAIGFGAITAVGFAIGNRGGEPVQ